MKIDVELVKELRRLTSAGVMDCKTALEESEGDVQKAIDILRKKGISKAANKSDRATNQGTISSYVHFNGQLGSLVEILCETDFVSSNKVFKEFAELIAMHIAASQPTYISKEDVPQDVIDREKEIYRDQMKDEKKPDNIKEKIIENKLNKFYEENCLIHQIYSNEDQFKGTVDEFIKSHIAKFGENIKVSRFSLFKIGS